jgi:hypothetical protein
MIQAPYRSNPIYISEQAPISRSQEEIGLITLTSEEHDIEKILVLETL